MDSNTQRNLIYIVILLIVCIAAFWIGGVIHELQGPDCWTLGNCNF